jgi:hypothetical protein
MLLVPIVTRLSFPFENEILAVNGCLPQSRAILAFCREVIRIGSRKTSMHFLRANLAEWAK